MSEEITKTAKKVTKTVSLNDGISVKVKSGFYGRLYYKNPRSGEEFVWNHMGEILFLTIGDLKAMKSQSVGYFKNQWIVIVGVADDADCSVTPAEIYKYLAIDHYYKNFIDPTTFKEACDWADNEIAEKVSLFTEGAKHNLIVALQDFIKNGTLDSRRKIRAFEKALGCEFEDE